MSKQITTKDLVAMLQQINERLDKIEGQAKETNTRRTSKKHYERVEFAGKTKVNAELKKMKGIKVETIGTYLWVSNTLGKENSDILKSLGFSFAKSKKLWYVNTAKKEVKKEQPKKDKNGKYVSKSLKELRTLYK